ncbi:septum site-determining protein Ssd [Amycolatopsis minnesotensis]|uniref:Rv3660c-like CheY-like N-terminal domain-containing protein n=1 Tax=Amycolatopsis minnesotensis TaxID=337894 RepID=A0ABN2Q3I4_9PSEU
MTGNRPLVVASDPTLLDEILRLAAAAGCETECAPDLLAARDSWESAPLVLVDERAATGGPLPRRSRVVLVSKGPPEPSTWQHVFRNGVEKVVSLPDDEAGLLAALAEVVDGPDVPGGRVLAVAGGRGGAGASVFAAAVALRAATEGEAMLVDCDPLGGGIDLLLGAEFGAGLRWPELRLGAGSVSMPALSAALPRRRTARGELPFVSCDHDGQGPAAQAVATVVEAGRRAGYVVVCDLPRSPGAAAMAVLDRADLAVLVVPMELRACVAAKCVLRRFGRYAGKVRLVVRGPAPSDVTAEQVAESVGAPMLTTMASDRWLPKAVERGEFDPRPRSALGRAARTVLSELTTPRTAERVPL